MLGDVCDQRLEKHAAHSGVVTGAGAGKASGAEGEKRGVLTIVDPLIRMQSVRLSTFLRGYAGDVHLEK